MEYIQGYPAAKAQADALELAVSQYDAALRAFPRGAMGLTPDEVKFSPAYREAKQAYARAFAELRAFNAVFVKQYANDIRREQASRRKTGAA